MNTDVRAGWELQAVVPSGPGLTPGDVVGDKYRIEAIIGRGGMSVVYRATHLRLDQQVALKVLSAEALHLPEYVVRLKREARAVSRIRSEHVVRIHDIGELEARPGVAGVPYLVMEHLSGLDLAAVLARHGALSVELAVEYLLQACEALAEAHALGIVHRDLKPANLFLTSNVDGSPCVKVLDFGISRMSRRHGLSSLTDPGTVLGTPSYMAPEQMEAADSLDARSDIWGLGTILYELLVGKPPYAGDSLPQIFIKIMRSRPPKPSLTRSDVPSALDAVVARCLAVDASDRYPSVADLAWALSTLGTPRGRDSAERISRVFDKRSVEDGDCLPEAVPHASPESWRLRGVAAARVIATFAGAAILGAASVFAIVAARGAAPGSAQAATNPAAVVTEVLPLDTPIVIPAVTRAERGASFVAPASTAARTARIDRLQASVSERHREGAEPVVVSAPEPAIRSLRSSVDAAPVELAPAPSGEESVTPQAPETEADGAPLNDVD